MSRSMESLMLSDVSLQAELRFFTGPTVPDMSTTAAISTHEIRHQYLIYPLVNRLLPVEHKKSFRRLDRP